MASWKKYFSAVPGPARAQQRYEVQQREGGAQGGTAAKYNSYLPEVYSGAPNRIERYIQYEQMDLDSEISRALDTISDFSTQTYEQGDEPFQITFKETLTETEIKLLKDTLSQWCSLNKWQQRLWRMFRNVVKYGDQVYIRDPETFKLIWIDPTKVEKIIVNESRGKEIEQYVIRDLDFNLTTLVGTSMLVHDQYSFPGGYPRSSNPAAGAGTVNYGVPSSPGSRSSRFNMPENQFAVDSTHVVHLSLSEGMDSQWPFGTSILESIYKVYKQKDLLEDAVLIYRVSRAPERRIFKIDVGNMPTHLAMQFVERVKNEMHQRRIPTVTGGGANMLDATYNPLSINEDYFFPQSADGRGSSVDTLQGGQNLGEIDDLKYFNNKMARGLRVPSSYLPTGPDDSDRAFNDGKVGTALIQEYRFNKYCERLQSLICQTLDDEFKMFLKWRGFNIDSGLFNLRFCAPQNFASYRQGELDASRISSFTQLEQLPYLSKRFMLERFLGLSEAEIQRNDEMWAEERDKPEMNQQLQAGLRAVGVTPGGIESDLAMGQELAGAPPGMPGAPGAGAELPQGAAPGGPGGVLPAAATPVGPAV